MVPSPIDFLDVPLARILRAKVASEAIDAKGNVLGTMPEIPGIETIHLLRSRDALALKRLPKTMAIIGAGSTGCEIAVLFASLGSRVLLLEREPVILPRWDEEVSKLVGARLCDLGIEVSTSAHILEAINATGAVYGLRVRNDAGDVETHALEAVVLTAGQGRSKIDPAMPRVAFVGSEAASVGLTASEARGKLGGALVGRCDVSLLARAGAERSSVGFVKVVAHPKTRKVVGCQIVADRAGEMIHEFAMAIRLGATVDKIASMPRAFGTWSEGAAVATERISKA